MAPSRRPLFWALTLLTPFALLACFEGIFRLTGLFAPEPLFVETSVGGEQVEQLNQWVARRYFDAHRVSVPALAPEVFPRAKTPGTLRIFCIGESTTAGFPFECQVPFPCQLRYLLAHRYPSRTIEVINCGISAVNSFTLVDLLPEILRARPDLIIAYAGHNEFYGAYGSASSVSLGGDDGFIRLFMRCEHLRIMQMVRWCVAEVTGWFIHPAASRETLMQSVVREQEIPYRSEQYARTLAAFRTNMEIICDACAASGVPVIVSTLFSNVRDQPPFRSASAPPGVARALPLSEGLRRAGRLEEGRSLLEEALKTDSSCAELWYELGTLASQMHDSSGARVLLEGARDRDLMRFRASTDVNGILRALAQHPGVTLVDMEGEFRRRSAQGLISNSLLCDHLHPNPDGYYLMAIAFARAVEQSGLLRDPDTSFVVREGPYHVTDLDWDIGLMKIFEMVHRWPFREVRVSRADYPPHGDSLAARIAAGYLYGPRNVWSSAHYAMAGEWLKRKNPEAAREEFRAVTVFAPRDPYPFVRIADTYEMEGRWKEREAALREALEKSPKKGLLLYQIALSRWKQGDLRGAAANMEAADSSPELNREERQNVRFHLAGFSADVRDTLKAREILELILADDPGFAPARRFLSMLTPPPAE